MDTFIIKNPNGYIPNCARHNGGTLLGVRLPRSVTFFDVREFDEDVYTKLPCGSTLYSSERAMVALGLKDSWGSGYATSPLGVTFYFDSRKETNNEETIRIIKGMRQELARYWRQYRKAKRNPAKAGQGGGCYYKPVALTLANFGGSLLADDRTMIVA